MKHALYFLLVLSFVSVGRAADDASGDFNPKLLTADKMIVILGSFTNFMEAQTHAKAISRASGMPFSLQGMIYDRKRGLILPDNDPDTIYAGAYILRRYNRTFLSEKSEETEFISIERSDAYPGLKPGYYIIVGGIYDDAREARKALSRFKLPASDAYAKKTQIYMGCMH